MNSITLILICILSILLNVVQLVIMFKILFWKRKSRIEESNKNIINREIKEQEIKAKYDKKKEELIDEKNNAKNASDFVDIIRKRRM